MGCLYSKHNLTICTFENTPTFSFNKSTYQAKVVNVYDGDTIWVAIKHLNKYIKIKIRLEGIDTPELGTKNFKEKEKAIDSRDYLKHLINNRIIKLKCGNFDKNGILLGKIYFKNICINNIMIETGHAIAYDSCRDY